LMGYFAKVKPGCQPLFLLQYINIFCRLLFYSSNEHLFRRRNIFFSHGSAW